MPVLLDDDDGVCRGNDWSGGFMRGVEMRRESWAELILDEEQGGWVLVLYHEHDEDPELRPGPIEPEKREEIIVQKPSSITQMPLP